VIWVTVMLSTEMQATLTSATLMLARERLATVTLVTLMLAMVMLATVTLVTVMMVTAISATLMLLTDLSVRLVKASLDSEKVDWLTLRWVKWDLLKLALVRVSQGLVMFVRAMLPTDLLAKGMLVLATDSKLVLLALSIPLPTARLRHNQASK
jgi:hypothetical protein